MVVPVTWLDEVMFSTLLGWRKKAFYDSALNSSRKVWEDELLHTHDSGTPFDLHILTSTSGDGGIALPEVVSHSEDKEMLREPVRNVTISD